MPRRIVFILLSLLIHVVVFAEEILEYSLGEKYKLILEETRGEQDRLEISLLNKATHQKYPISGAFLNQMTGPRIQVPKGDIKSHDLAAALFAYDHPELQELFKAQKLFVVAIPQEKTHQLLIVPIESVINEIENKLPASAYLLENPRNKNFQKTTFFLKEINLGTETTTSSMPGAMKGLLFTSAYFNPEQDRFAHSSLTISRVINGSTKTAIITEGFIPVGENSVYTVSKKTNPISNELLINITNQTSGVVSDKTVSFSNLRWKDFGELTNPQNLVNAEFKLSNYTISKEPKKPTNTDSTEPKAAKVSSSTQVVLYDSAKSYLNISSEHMLGKSEAETDASIEKEWVPAKWPRGIDEENEFNKKLVKGISRVLKGQPEVLDFVKRMEKGFQSSGRIYKDPNISWLAGMPGVGKDTFVETYILVKHQLLYPGKEIDIEKHIFRLPIVKTDHDLWDLVGSRKGHVGEGELTAFIKWIVLHSGGKYKIVKENADKGKSAKERVELNSEWKPGIVLPGYHSPEEGVLFVNEFHDWGRMGINLFLKEALEKGIFPVSGGSGLGKIQVPINTVIASNHGISKISSLDITGKRVGPELSYEQLMENWQRHSQNLEDLIEEIKSPTPANKEGGLSPEMVTRIPKSNFILLRPLNKEALLSISSFQLSQLEKKFQRKKLNGYPSFNFKFDNSVVEFLAVYGQSPEESSRLIKDKVNSLIEATLSDAISNKKITDEKQNYLISIRKNKDGTHSLLLKDKHSEQSLFVQLTKKDKYKQPISDQELEGINQLEGKLNLRVRGVSHIVKKMVSDIRTARNSDGSGKAMIFGFFGLSSTGKTELGRALHQELFKTDTEPFKIDFNQVKSPYDLKELLFGSKNLNSVSGEVYRSPFMNRYDQSDGKLVIIFDEMTNASTEILNILYDFLDKSKVEGFSDNKARSMANVNVIINGNLGENWYNAIRGMDIPETEQYEAARKIYHSSIANENFKRATLLEKFTEAFVNRVGLDRFYFFGPHEYKTIRELIQDKLLVSLKELSAPKEGVRTWDVRFATIKDYEQTVFAIEKYGFRLWSQGRSVNTFINDQFKKEIQDLLLKYHLPNGAKILIKKVKDKVVSNPKGFEEPSTQVNFELEFKNRDNKSVSLPLSLRGKFIEKPVAESEKAFILTAFHEAAHSFLNVALLGDKIRPVSVKITPGVTMINNKWIRYGGVAESENIERLEYTREAVVARLAVLLGGGVAEGLATKNKVVTAGHSNDLERVTEFARKAVVHLGVGNWKGVTQSSEKPFEEYFIGLSEDQKLIVTQEVDKLIEEARGVASNMLMAHFDSIIIPLAKNLSEQAELDEKDLKKFYSQKSSSLISFYNQEAINKGVLSYKDQISKSSPISNYLAMRDFEFHDFIKASDFKVFNLEKRLEQKRRKDLKDVDLSLGHQFVEMMSNFKEALLAKYSGSKAHSRTCLKYYNR
ncbi:MAG: AAA family ATPase [Bdellovibrionaceae bacterium]|nr:AAA family ATPase [Pseudobdellovibrionaceae bacterium]